MNEPLPQVPSRPRGVGIQRFSVLSWHTDARGRLQRSTVQDLNVFLIRPVERMGDAGGEAAGHRQLARHQRLLEQYKEKLRRNDTRSCCLRAVAGATRPACTSGAILTRDVSVARSDHSKLAIKHDTAIITGSSARSSASNTPRNPRGDPQRATSPRARASGEPRRVPAVPQETLRTLRRLQHPPPPRESLPTWVNLPGTRWHHWTKRRGAKVRQGGQ